MSVAEPESSEELSDLLRECASRRENIRLFGNSTKYAMGGPVTDSDRAISMAGLRRVLCYEPHDLTISVEAGHPFKGLQCLLAKHGQMVALDPPFSEHATVGGVIATNGNGPMRRAFGTARDLVIGMKFATLEGRTVQTGGMVVKNVAGLDMAKIMIGSFGTLAAITSVNFRLHSLPDATETFLYSFPDLEAALMKRDAVLRSPLQPIAVDVLSPAIAIRFGRRGHVLAIRAAGYEAVLRRYRREFSDSEILSSDQDRSLWTQIQEFPSDFLARHPEGVIIRVSTTLNAINLLPKTVSGSYICRAGSGITYMYFPSWTAAAPWWRKMEGERWPAVVEFATNETKLDQTLWRIPNSGPEAQSFMVMQKIKQMFDSNQLLNAKRLYGRI
jgi:glycolate oxidase FAD binding subunit